MDTKVQSKPTANTLRIEGSNDLFIWNEKGNWWQVVPFVSVISTPDDVGGMPSLIPALVRPYLFDPGLWPDGYIGFTETDERVYFDIRGSGDFGDPYTVWSIVGGDANELESGVIALGPDALPGIVEELIGKADAYFERGYTPV